MQQGSIAQKYHLVHFQMCYFVPKKSVIFCINMFPVAGIGQHSAFSLVFFIPS